MNPVVDDELLLPRATLMNIVKSLLPETVKISGNTLDILMDLSVKYINYLAYTANVICNNQNKKTITAGHVIDSLKSLGLESYLAKLLDVCGEEVEVDNKKAQEILAHKMSFKRKKKKLESAENHEELVEEQEKLFMVAKEFNSTSTTPMAKDANEMNQNFLAPEQQIQMLQLMQMMQQNPANVPQIPGTYQQLPAMPQMDFNEYQQLQQLMAFQAMQAMQQQANMQFPQINPAEMSTTVQEAPKGNEKATAEKKDDGDDSEDFEKYD